MKKQNNQYIIVDWLNNDSIIAFISFKQWNLFQPILPEDII